METLKGSSRRSQVDFDNLGFGDVFSDHMFSMKYRDGAWGEREVLPYGEIGLTPAASVLHYAQAVFEGMKAFAAQDGSVNIFRPQKHHERWNNSCRRMCIPEIDYDTFLGSLVDLIKLDRDWVPRKRGQALYLRPFVFADESHIGMRVSETYRYLVITSPVGAYFKGGMSPVRLVTSGEYVRAVRGGVGATKTPANYAASLYPSQDAKNKGFSQVLWLDALDRKYVEEVGTMNIFFVIGDELITAPLEGTILPGVTRDSAIQLAKDWGIKVSQRRLSIDEVVAGARDGTLREVFGAGTAAVISPVGWIQHGETLITINNGKIGRLSQELYDAITAIQYGEKPDKYGWCYRM